MGFPTPDKKKRTLKIYDKLPGENKETWEHSIPLESTAAKMRSIVLYAPGLKVIGTIDNSDSDGSASYSQSVATGFQFGTSYTIGAEVAMEVDAVFAKGTFKVSTSFTVSAQWSKTVTETMTFEVGPGKKAFIYQGFLNSAILEYADGKYEYAKDEGQCLTRIIATSRELKT